MHGHAYRQSPATHRVKTAYGTYHLCPACVSAKHAGIKHGNTPERLPVPDPGAAAPVCDCEHVDHFDSEQEPRT